MRMLSGYLMLYLPFSAVHVYDPETPEIYTLSLHDALPICASQRPLPVVAAPLLLLVGAGIMLASTDLLIAASWFGVTGRDWMRDALADQHLGGWIVIALALSSAAVAAPLLRRRIRRRSE